MTFFNFSIGYSAEFLNAEILNAELDWMPKVRKAEVLNAEMDWIFRFKLCVDVAKIDTFSSIAAHLCLWQFLG